MDITTVNMLYEKARGNLDDLEESEEKNACSIYVDVDVDGRTEKWLLFFKNETHNHPTEIELLSLIHIFNIDDSKKDSDFYPRVILILAQRCRFLHFL